MDEFSERSRQGAAPSSPTPLDGLLDQVRELRLTLAADLNAAAGAAEAGAADIAADIVAADRLEVESFMRAADLRLARLARQDAAGPAARRQWRRRVAYALPAVPLVGAMAVSAAAVTGALPMPHHGDPAAHAPAAASATPTSPITSSFQQLVKIVDSDPSASQVIAAAKALHRQIAALIATSPQNPASAAEVAELLRMEQSLLLREQPPGASVVLDATRRLAAQLVTAVPTPARPAPQPTDIATQLPKPQPSSTKSSASSSPSPSPTKKTSSPKPTSSSAPDPSSSPGSGQIPALP